MAGKYAKKSKKKWLWLPVLILTAAAGMILALEQGMGPARVARLAQAELPEWVEVRTIPVDGTSRSGIKLEVLHNVVIHYVGNPGTTALQNRNYYENPESSVSSHFLVGLEGEVLLCVPLDEKSSASNWRNKDTISIEVCHPDETGKFSEATYNALVKLTAWLLENSGLQPEDLIRHYDITGKACPKHFVDDPESWEAFRQHVAGTMD